MTWILLLAMLLAPISSAMADAEGAADLPCVLCHTSRDRAAYEALEDVPGVRVGSESAQAFVCYSCHNGSVVDSRSSLQIGGQHPDAVKMNRSSPKDFPLYEGVVECGTCHSPHGEAPFVQRWLRAPDDGISTCSGCHGKHDLHIGKVLDSYTAEQVRLYGGRPGGDGEITCLTCHDPHGALGPKLLIEKYGPENDGFCRICHSSLSVKGNFAFEKPIRCADCHSSFSKSRFMTSGGEAGPCVHCHDLGAAGKDHPAESNICADCHSMHHPIMSDGMALGLLRLPMGGGMLCNQCHEALGARHNGLKNSLGAVDEWLVETRGMQLDETSGIVCSTCHKSHGSKKDPLLTVSSGIMCLYCHPSQNPYGPRGVRPETHSMDVPLDEEQAKLIVPSDGKVLKCPACHTAHKVPATSEIPCADCHANHAGGSDHGGVKGCSACHSVHGDVPPVEKCEGCHEEAGNIRGHGKDSEVEKMPAYDKLGRRVPLGGVRCPTCHDPHGKRENMLRVESFSGLCLVCHEEKASIKGGPHDGNVLLNDGREGRDSCDACHTIHAAPLGDSEDPMGDVCRECHGKELNSKVGHGPRGLPVWKALDGKLPLFDRSGARNSFGFISCPSCHDVHGGKGEGAMRIGNEEPVKLCLLCHPEKKSILGTSHARTESGKGGDCSLCHKVHFFGDQFSVQDSEAAALGSWNDRKCSRCHQFAAGKTSKFAEPKSHPVNVALERGVESPFPLYDPLGGRAGRLVTCSTCHDVHGVSGGTEILPKYLRTGTSVSELCLGCHVKETAILGTQHDVKEKRPRGGGPCGVCHVVHGAKEEKSLWRFPPGDKEGYLPNRLCRTCHRLGGVVDSGELLQYHMMDAEPLKTARGTGFLQKPMFLFDQWALNSGDDPLLPLFDRDGNPGPEGNLQCVSCHNPHQWSPLGPFVKPGFGNLGPNVTTNFLKFGESESIEKSVCASCHGGDVVEKYQKYHSNWEDL